MGQRVGREKGQALAWAMVFMAMAALVVTPLLTYAGVTLRGRDKALEQAYQQAAAEAAIKRVMADLKMGADGIPTTYATYNPHLPGQSYTDYQITTSYTLPSVTVNGYAVSLSLSSPSPGTEPVGQQQYFDPGTLNPDFATLPGGYGYLMRIFNVRQGILIINWAYSPAGVSRVGVWDGLPVDDRTGQPFPPGLIDRWPKDPPTLDTGSTPATATNNLSVAMTIGPGLYSVVFDNTRGRETKTTAPFAPSGGTADTWVYVSAYRDYVITATAGDVTLQAYVRQIPGYTQPPNTDWSPTSVSWVPSGAFIRSWTLP